MFCSDEDADTVTFATNGQPAHGSSRTNGGQITYTANAGYVGPDSVPFTASDGHGGTDSGSWPVDVHAAGGAELHSGPDRQERAAR